MPKKTRRFFRKGNALHLIDERTSTIVLPPPPIDSPLEEEEDVIYGEDAEDLIKESEPLRLFLGSHVEKISGGQQRSLAHIWDLEDQDEVEVDPSSVQGKLVVAVPHAITNLEFKGTLTGMSSNLAMLEDGAGTGYTVRVGDIIGKPPEFVRVKMITNNKITFEPVLGVPEEESADSPRLRKLLRENDGSSATEMGAK